MLMPMPSKPNEDVMESNFNDNLLRLRRLTNEMLALADDGDTARNDASCGILYGILRDMAYRLRELADRECEQHKSQGKWL